MSGGLSGTRAARPFRFVDYEGLQMSTGLKARDLAELADRVRAAPREVIHNHLRRAPLRHRFGVWDYPNDFAQWAAHALEDLALAEKLAALDPYAERDLDRARDAVVELIEEHLEDLASVPAARPGFEFHFTSGHYLALPAGREAWTLHELREALVEISLGSLYYHFHEARLRGPADDADDFSRWIVAELGSQPVAARFRELDFYFYSLEDLRQMLVAILDEHLVGDRP